MHNLKRTYKILGVLLFMTFFIHTTGAFASTTFTYSAWIPYWQKTEGVAEAKAHSSQLQVVSPFSYDVKDDGTLSDTAKITEDPWTQFRGVKIIPTILWTNTSSILSVLSDSSLRQNHISQIMNVANNANVQGIDIDYENKSAATRPYFSTFLKELSQSLHSQNKILSCTIEPRTPISSRFVTVPQGIEYANDFVVINKVCDQVRILAYDQQRIDIKLNKQKGIEGGVHVPYIPVADIDWVTKVIKETRKSIKAKKIILGIPTYGHQYEITPDSNAPGGFTYSRIGSITYQDARALSTEAGQTPLRNSAGEMSFTYTEGASIKFVDFTDTNAIAAKIKLAKKLGLGGVIFYKIDGQGDASMWNYVK